MRTTLAAVLLASVSLVACGGGDDDDTVTPVIDAPIGGDPDAPAANCTATASHGDKGALTGSAYFSPGMAAGDATDDVLEYVALLDQGATPDGLDILLYAGYGAFSAGAITPGTYQLTGEELNFATCGVCVLMATDVTEAGYADDYMAVSGTVEITAVGTALGQTFTGRLTNIQFAHVNIDENTLETTAAGDSCSSSLTNATFTGTLAAPPTGRLASPISPLASEAKALRLRR